MIKFDLINVIDCEATCYPDDLFPEGETRETIEIGVAVVDVTKLAIVERDQIVIRNRRSKVSPYCTDLTGWTEEKLWELGCDYGEACSRLRKKHNSLSRHRASQGSGDIRLFQEGCQLFESRYPFPLDHLDISHLFALAMRRVKRDGLSGILTALGLEFEGRQHSGFDDAYNEARVLIELIKRFGLPV